MLLAGAIAHAQDRRTLMVTIEPWPTSGQPANADVLGDVVSGSADGQLRRLADLAAANRPQVILVRWGHEMELSDLYPWGAQDPALYTAAYRHVVSIFRGEGADNVRFVWSPAGQCQRARLLPGRRRGGLRRHDRPRRRGLGCRLRLATAVVRRHLRSALSDACAARQADHHRRGGCERHRRIARPTGWQRPDNHSPPIRNSSPWSTSTTATRR